MFDQSRQLLIDSLSGYVGQAIEGELVAFATIAGDDKSAALDAAITELPKYKIASVWVVAGPGNFTAIRVGIGYARAVAWAMGVPSFGVGVFDIDHAHLGQVDAVIFRDARGGRFYRAEFAAGGGSRIMLTDTLGEGYSAEALPGTQPIATTLDTRARCLAALSARGQFHSSPARAHYIRAADAALPGEPPLVILDD